MIAHAADSERRRLVALREYFLVPLVLGFAVGVHQAGFGAYFSVWGSLILWEIHHLIFWTCCLGAAALLDRVRTIKRWPLIGRLVAAALLGAMFSRPIFWITYQLRLAYAIQSGASAEAVARPLRVFEPSADFLVMIVQLYSPNIIMWTAVCYAMARVMPVPFVNWDGDIQAADPAALLDSSSEQPGLSQPWLSRVKPEIGRNVRWLKAEGHYVRVCTDLGSDLVHHRFSDAVEQLHVVGLQVHRSHWVSYDALRHPDTRIANGVIHLGPEEAISIGPSYKLKVREVLQTPSHHRPPALINVGC